MDFKKKFSFDERLNESSRVNIKYPDRLPIIVEISKNDINNIKLDKKKYLVPKDLSIAQFMYIIRKRINLISEKALFIFFNNKLEPASKLISDVYEIEKDKDGFLYSIISLESTFG